MINPIVLAIGWVIGAMSLVLGVLACYYMYKTSRLYGGGIGSNLKKICLGTVALIIGLIVLGGILTAISQTTETNIMDALLIVTIFTVPGFMSMLMGARNLAKLATGAK